MEATQTVHLSPETIDALASAIASAGPNLTGTVPVSVDGTALVSVPGTMPVSVSTVGSLDSTAIDAVAIVVLVAVSVYLGGVIVRWIRRVPRSHKPSGQ